MGNCVWLNRSKANAYCNLFELFYEWKDQLVKLENGEITREEYDRWRYYYPKLSAVSVDPPLKATDLLQPITYTTIENEGPNETPAIYEDYEKLTQFHLELQYFLLDLANGFYKHLVTLARGIFQTPVFPMGTGKERALDIAPHGDDHTYRWDLRHELLSRGDVFVNLFKLILRYGIDFHTSSEYNSFIRFRRKR